MSSDAPSAEAAVQAALAAARDVVASGVLSLSRHGNISVRIGDSDRFVYSIARDLSRTTTRDLVQATFEGRLTEGTASDYTAAMIPLHAAIYRARPDTACTIHSHSRNATAFAVAREPIRPWTEAFRLYGMEDGVPVAAYAPRESPAAAANVAKAIAGVRTQAVLIANHGVICFNRSPELAVLTSILVEETAELGRLAQALGEPQLVPLQRRS